MEEERVIGHNGRLWESEGLPRPMAGERGMFEFVVIEYHNGRDDGLRGDSRKALAREDHLLRFRIDEKHKLTGFWYVHTTHLIRPNERFTRFVVDPKNSQPVRYQIDRWGKEIMVSLLRSAWELYTIGYAGDVRGLPRHWDESESERWALMTELKQ